jgi:regulator of sirC expression with transglutaminase-like and TPR domain
MDPTTRFRRLVQGPEDDLRLDEAALLIAAHAHPDLDVDARLAELDELAAGCTGDVVQHLFGTLGFRGNTDDYGDPRNSFLDDVLDRRLGIPITLSLLLMEVGRRLGITFVGVGLPGHFVVRRGDVFLDPFEGGRVLSDEECAEHVRRIYGGAIEFDPSMLAPVGPRAILARMLANLKQRFTMDGNLVDAEWVIRLRTLIPDVGERELAELAGAQAAMGSFRAAAETLEDWAEQLPADDAAEAVARARRLRARLN